jgi:quinol-cytochrome oxidoreductase complex cytochrome b subunit
LATLANFFVLNVAFIPATLFLLLLLHFWLVRRAGGLARVEQEDQDEESTQRVPIS